ncbi:MAG: hypothetical protein MUO67_18715 [Anaerolineales bacterium]|nr:hypothetical protein [Anaerolineales bacterium]
MDPYISEAQDLFDFTRELRRDIHRHPEIGFQEVRTAAIVEKELNKLGLEVWTGIAETGVVAVLDGEGSGPVVLAILIWMHYRLQKKLGQVMLL